MTVSPPSSPPKRALLFGSTSDRALADILRTETVGGLLLLAGALIALVWANSPLQDGYRALLELRAGPHALHLDLELQQWAADGLLAIFFFVAGLELKREFVDGELRDPARAVLPVIAALSGVALPAVIFLALTVGDPSARSGWAVPVATDIAFALAVLAVIGRHLPASLRSFLLTLAVVDDLVAIVIIAIAYTSDLHPLYLLLALAPLALFAVLVRRGVIRWWLLAPLGVIVWALVHASGIHATVAGVALALTVPALRRDGDDRASLAERLEHTVRPLSSGLAVPLFALTAAGVTVTRDSFQQATADPAFLAVIGGLVCGKAIGVFGGTWLTARFTRAELSPDLTWPDVFGAALLAGIGFTVALLIGGLAFGPGSERNQGIRLAVLLASLLATALAALVLLPRNRRWRQQRMPEGSGSSGTP